MHLGKFQPLKWLLFTHPTLKKKLLLVHASFYNCMPAVDVIQNDSPPFIV